MNPSTISNYSYSGFTERLLRVESLVLLALPFLAPRLIQGVLSK